MKDIAKLQVCGYSITVDYNYVKGTSDTLECPGDPEELDINSWYFTDDIEAQVLADSEGLALEELLGSEWLNDSIMDALWDYVRDSGYDDYEEYDDDYLYDTDNLDWDS